MNTGNKQPTSAPPWQINAGNAKAILGGMGYVCDVLDAVACIPEAAVEALRSAWDSSRAGKLQSWEIDLIAICLHEPTPESPPRQHSEKRGNSVD